MRRLHALLLVTLLAPVAGADADAAAPALVVATPLNGGSALVTWAPGGASADAYLVYGIDRQGGATLLVAVQGSAFHALVPGGWSGYAVAAVHAGTEGQRVRSSECVHVELDESPPAIAFGTDCMRAAPRRPMFRSYAFL